MYLCSIKSKKSCHEPRNRKSANDRHRYLWSWMFLVCRSHFSTNAEPIKRVICIRTSANPTYEEVCTGATGHAEVCQLIFDPKKVNYKTLLQAFWESHDPTTLNKQGGDVGTQYRSVIFYHSAEQKTIAEFYKNELQKSGAFENEIVTTIVPAEVFYEAEKYHQNYFNQHGDQPYCQFVIRPKVEKFQKAFKNKLK